jgi:TonB family protein
VSGLKPSAANSRVESDRIRDGLVGPVRRIRTEVVKLSSMEGKIVEGKPALLEMVAYDIKGNKIQNQYFPVAGATLTGKEMYKYDDKGNISEMTLLNDDGSLLGKENYKYEFDFAGNWNKMTTSVAVIDSGKVSFEPAEITYRSILYYLDENMMKMSQPGAQPNAVSGAPSNSTSAMASEVKTNSEPKPQPGVEAAAKKQPRHAVASLPPSSIGGEKFDMMNSAEARNVSPSSSAATTNIELESEPPPSPTRSPLLKPISGGVLNGTAISLPAPMYPDTARRMRISGTVVVDVVIDETGKVVAAQASNGPTTLREAAVKASFRARFSPTKLSGQPVKVAGLIYYKFSLVP